MNDHDEDDTPPIDAYASGFVDGAAHIRATALDDAFNAGMRAGLETAQQPPPDIEVPMDPQGEYAQWASRGAATTIGRLIGLTDPCGELVHELLVDQVNSFQRAFSLISAACDQADGLDSQQLLVNLAGVVQVYCDEIATPTLRRLGSLHWATRQAWGEPPGETTVNDRIATEVAATLAFVQVTQDALRKMLQQSSINIMKNRDADGVPQG